MNRGMFVPLLVVLAFGASCGADSKKDAKKDAEKPTGDEPTACPSDSGGETGDDMADMDMEGMQLSSHCTEEGGGQEGLPITSSAFYVVNGGSASISVIDPKAKAVIATIALTDAAFPHHLSLNSTTDDLVVAVPGMDLSAGHEGSAAGMHGSLILLNAKTGTTGQKRSLDAMNHNGIFSPDGNEIWTSAMSAPGSVLVLDAKTLVTKTTIPVGDMPAEVTFSKDGTYAFVANGESGNVSVVSLEKKSVVKTISVGADPVGAWQGGDGIMYVDNEKGKSISAIDALKLSVVRTYDLGFTPGMAATAPNGELWVTDGDNGKVTYFMAGDTMKMGDIATGAGAHGIAFSSDGLTAAVTNQKAATVTLIDVKSHKLIQNVQVGKKPNGIVYRKQ